MKQNTTRHEGFGDGGEIPCFQNEPRCAERGFDHTTQKCLSVGMEEIGVFEDDPADLTGFDAATGGRLDAIP
jgi:hypothetical protein